MQRSTTQINININSNDDYKKLRQLQMQNDLLENNR